MTPAPESWAATFCELCGRSGMHFCVGQAKHDKISKLRQDLWERAVLAGRSVEEADVIVKAHEERFSGEWCK